jgi:hypothetical protein
MTIESKSNFPTGIFDIIRLKFESKFKNITVREYRISDQKAARSLLECFGYNINKFRGQDSNRKKKFLEAAQKIRNDTAVQAKEFGPVIFDALESIERNKYGFPLEVIIFGYKRTTSELNNREIDIVTNFEITLKENGYRTDIFSITDISLIDKDLFNDLFGYFSTNSIDEIRIYPLVKKEQKVLTANAIPLIVKMGTKSIRKQKLL